MDFVPLPRFCSEKLSIWFAQVESTFALNGVLSEHEKYDYVVTNIPMEYATLVEDIILNPPAEDRYEYLKNEFIKRMSIHLMKKEQQGNMKPSVYLVRLRRMADRRVPNETIMNIWLNNLPEKVREIVSIESSRSVDALCELADKVMTLVTQPAVLEIDLAGNQFAGTMNRVNVNELTKQMQVVQMVNDSSIQQSQQPQQPPPGLCLVSYPKAQVQGVRDNTNNSFKGASTSQPVICWYHAIYGDRAMACVSPCQYKLCSPYYAFRQ